jgi:polyphosphate glucokinase
LTSQPARVYGIDIGGSGIKGAVVDTVTGQLVTQRTRILTPQPATPDAVAAVVARLLIDADWHGRVGATFPAVIKHGVAKSAANVDKSWIGTDVDACFTKAAGDGNDVIVLNDADAAGIAEARFGAAKDVSGVVILLTFGTGIGSALLFDGTLVPNTELGHLELDGHDAERRAAASVRDEENLSYEKWAKRVNAYMTHVEQLFTPDLFVVGGGVSKDSEKWVPLLKLETPVRPAQLLNDAGIVGAAMAAAERRGE